MKIRAEKFTACAIVLSVVLLFTMAWLIVVKYQRPKIILTRTDAQGVEHKVVSPYAGQDPQAWAHEAIELVRADLKQGGK